ncbi:MAG: LemA family protein [Phycisphaerae bacterium]|nr:LemA family protein [Saprospiraceae bacterium]
MTNFRKYLPIILVILVAVLGMSMCNTYNKLGPMEEGIKAKWSEVENQYQRRMALMDQAVATVRAGANYEKSTLEAVVQARASATQVKVDANNLSPEAIQRFEQSQNALASTMKSLLAVVEAYPNLKANQGFLDLQTQIEGTENRIAMARRNFNEAVNGFNAYIRRFPTNLLSGVFGFSPKGYFQAESGADKTPDLNQKFGQ